MASAYIAGSVGPGYRCNDERSYTDNSGKNRSIAERFCKDASVYKDTDRIVIVYRSEDGALFKFPASEVGLRLPPKPKPLGIEEVLVLAMRSGRSVVIDYRDANGVLSQRRATVSRYSWPGSDKAVMVYDLEKDAERQLLLSRIQEVRV